MTMVMSSSGRLIHAGPQSLQAVVPPALVLELVLVLVLVLLLLLLGRR